MTDVTTQQKRDIELEYYREKLTELANHSYAGAEPEFFSRWAESVLTQGELMTGPGVDMTDEERAAAVKLLEG